MRQSPKSTLFPYTTLFRSTIGRVSPGGLQFGPIYFDRTDPEDRDNNQLTGSISYFGSKPGLGDRKSTRLNSSHSQTSYAVYCLKKKSHRTTSPTHSHERSH